MFFCENLFLVSRLPCLPLMAKNTWSPYLEGWIRKGEGSLGFSYQQIRSVGTKGGGSCCKWWRRNISSPPILYSHRYQAAIRPQPLRLWNSFLEKSPKVGVFISLIKWFLIKENDFESSATQTCSALKYDRVLLATISIGRPGMGAGRQILYFRCKASDFVFQVQK